MRFVPKPLKETADASRGKSDRKTVLKNALSVVLVLVAAYFVLGLIGIGLSEFIPDSWERRLASESATLLDKEGGDLPSLEMAEAILMKISEDVLLRDLEYRIFVLDFDAANAVAVPGGGIGLSPPLLETLETEEGLAFVLAHELGHHQHRHILRRIGRGLLIGVAAALTLSSYDLSPVQASIAIAENGYSRKQEREADEYALRLVFEKYGSAGSPLEFFDTILKEKNEPLWQKYLGTHPITEERIRKMRELLEQIQNEDV